MAIDFPASPSTNDTHTHNGLTWKWDGTSWILQTIIQSGGLQNIVEDLTPQLGGELETNNNNVYVNNNDSLNFGRDVGSASY